jgi:hypothetical protein
MAVMVRLLFAPTACNAPVDRLAAGAEIAPPAAMNAASWACEPAAPAKMSMVGAKRLSRHSRCKRQRSQARGRFIARRRVWAGAKWARSQWKGFIKANLGTPVPYS